MALLHGSAVAQAPNAEQLLQVAEKYYEQLEYESALKTLIQVHQTKGATPMQRARSFLYMGVCFTALGNAENAVQSFMELLKIKKSFRLPKGISPSIKGMFKEALFRLKMPEKPPPEAPKPGDGAGGAGGAPAGKIPVEMKARGPRSTTAGKPIDLRITLNDPRGLVEKVVVRWRRVGGPDFSTVKVSFKTGQKDIKARIPGATLGQDAGKLLYFVEASGRGMTLAHAGTMEEPKKISLVEPPEPKSNWKWWVIGIGGGLAVVGGVVAAIMLTQGEDGPSNPNEADVTITIH